LPGVGRKTANVVLGTAFEKNEGIVVDTHVIRLSKLLGLTQGSDPEKIEQDLMALLPRAEWTLISHLLVWHGRDAAVPVNRIVHIVKFRSIVRIVLLLFRSPTDLIQVGFKFICYFPFS